jgi:hypothetical protein
MYAKFMTRLLSRILEPAKEGTAIARRFYLHFQANGDPRDTLFCDISARVSASITAHYIAHRLRFWDLPLLLLFHIERAVTDPCDSHSMKDRPIARLTSKSTSTAKFTSCTPLSSTSAPRPGTTLSMWAIRMDERTVTARV